MVGVEEHMTNGADGGSPAGDLSWADHIDADIDVERRVVLASQPGLERSRHHHGGRSHTLRGPAVLVRFQEHRDPFIRPIRQAKELERCVAINHATPPAWAPSATARSASGDSRLNRSVRASYPRTVTRPVTRRRPSTRDKWTTR